ncbi:MAG: pilus assembly protein [Betaproteobacteria bacterium]|nr:pilus assembly protein [Betaproteobacteria bacterium]
MIRRHFRALRVDQSGVTIVEFALITPVLLLTLMGLFDAGYNVYATSMLRGSIQKTARDSTIEGANTAALDANVTTAVQRIVPGATVTFSRKAYATFSWISKAEDYSDVNKNGTCDAGEPFEDSNGNGTWDTDRGQTGNGGARDAVIYTVNVTYPRAFPLAAFMKMSNTVTMSATMVLRNQPYTLPNQYTAKTANCI